MRIATPPRRGMGTACTSRSRTSVIAPVATASHLTKGVAAYVIAAATMKTRRYSRTDQRLARDGCSRKNQRRGGDGLLKDQLQKDQLPERGYAGKRPTRSVTCERISVALALPGSPSVWVKA